MKFRKKYEEYMKGRGGKQVGLPAVGLKELKKILKKCRTQVQSQNQCEIKGGSSDGCSSSSSSSSSSNQSGFFFPMQSQGKCPDHCPVCDGTFFPLLLEEMSVVAGCFNERAQKLLEFHLASGFRKIVIWFTSKFNRNHEALMQEGKDLVAYALINSVAMRKILKKYDKIHHSKQGQIFRSKARKMHIEILQSPWLCELMAFHINLKGNDADMSTSTGLFGECSLVFEDGQPMLSCGLFDSLRIDVDLTCPICLETVFDPVALTCGHIFCYICCCSASSVSIVDGLEAASLKAKCPVCRQEGVFQGAVHLDELNLLLSNRCPEYWEARLQTERVERLRQIKEHWESQSRALMGI